MHTPTPWVSLGMSIWSDPSHRQGVGNCIDLVGSVNTGRPESENLENAALIVKAVNSYEAMREALQQAEMWVGRLIADGGHLNCVMPNHAINTLQKIERALALAEGKE